MTIQNPRELNSTRRKLVALEQQILELRETDQEMNHTDTLTVRSLVRLVNQLKEEIIQFELAQEVAPQ